MGNGLGQDDAEEGAPVGVAQGVSRFILAPVDGAHAHFQQPEHGSAEGERKADHRHENAADGNGTENDVIQNHEQHHHGHPLHQPHGKPRHAVGDDVPVPAEHEHQEAQGRAKEYGQDGDEQGGQHAVPEQLPAVLTDKGFVKAILDRIEERFFRAIRFGGSLTGIGCGKVAAQYGQNDPAIAGGIGKQHLLLSLRRYVHICGEVILAGLNGRNPPGEIHVAQLQGVAPIPAEANHEINIVAHVLPVLDVGKRRVRGGGNHLDGSPFPGQIGHIQNLFFFINAIPDVFQIFHGAVFPAPFQEIIQFRAEGGAVRVILPKGKGVIILGDPVMDIVDFRLLRVNGEQPQFVP